MREASIAIGRNHSCVYRFVELAKPRALAARDNPHPVGPTGGPHGIVQMGEHDVGNIKCAITGTHRKPGPDHAERYLASFAWRYNRRYQLQTTIPPFVHSKRPPA